MSGTAAAITPTQQPTAAAATPVSTAPAPSGAAPSTNQQLEAEVSAAYLRYWDARAQASLTLNPDVLDDVADGEELAALRQDIEKLKAEGRAIRGEVQHQYTVLKVEGDQAQVLDRFRDFSIYVDPVTKQPLPGETRPTPEDAPLSTVLYQLRREGTTWKVVDAQRYANQ